MEVGKDSLLPGVMPAFSKAWAEDHKYACMCIHNQCVQLLITQVEYPLLCEKDKGLLQVTFQKSIKMQNATTGQSPAEMVNAAKVYNTSGNKWDPDAGLAGTQNKAISSISSPSSSSVDQKQSCNGLGSCTLTTLSDPYCAALGTIASAIMFPATYLFLQRTNPSLSHFSTSLEQSRFFRRIQEASSLCLQGGTSLETAAMNFQMFWDWTQVLRQTFYSCPYLPSLAAIVWQHPLSVLKIQNCLQAQWS